MERIMRTFNVINKVVSKIKSWFKKKEYQSQVVEIPAATPKQKLELVSRFEYGNKLWTRREWKARKRKRQLSEYHRLINAKKGT
jgi:predicted DNA-binding protein (UPF0278 family)